jgi:hypothetical protein
MHGSSAFATEASPVPNVKDLQSLREALGPHGGRLLRHRGREVEVKSSPGDKTLHAYVKKSEGEPPKNMSVTLSGNGKPNQSVQLKAVGSTPDGYYHYQSDPMSSAADLSPNQGSSMGAGIQIGFN